jgi:hypothetical protein
LIFGKPFAVLGEIQTALSPQPRISGGAPAPRQDRRTALADSCQAATATAIVDSDGRVGTGWDCPDFVEPFSMLPVSFPQTQHEAQSACFAERGASRALRAHACDSRFTKQA